LTEFDPASSRADEWQQRVTNFDLAPDIVQKYLSTIDN
jgi:hypothetical protein